MANILLTYWYKLYKDQTRHEEMVEFEISKLGVRYRTQHPFLAQKAFVDFYLPDLDLVVEVDDPKHLLPDRIAKDKKRTALLNSLGITVIRYTNQEVEKGRYLESMKAEINRRKKQSYEDDPSSVEVQP
jgi:very-short-patch-repair endonuclease